MDLIGRKAAIEALKIPDGEYPNPSERHGIIIARVEARRRIREISSVPAVPLDELCEMLSKFNVNVPCNDDCEGCEAFDGTGDTVNCWKVTLAKWMEEQDEQKEANH